MRDNWKAGFSAARTWMRRTLWDVQYSQTRAHICGTYPGYTSTRARGRRRDLVNERLTLAEARVRFWEVSEPAIEAGEWCLTRIS